VYSIGKEAYKGKCIMSNTKPGGYSRPVERYDLVRDFHEVIGAVLVQFQSSLFGCEESMEIPPAPEVLQGNIKYSPTPRTVSV